LGGGKGVELAVVESGEDVLDEECGNAVGELLLFIGARIEIGVAAPNPPKFIAWEPWLRGIRPEEKAASARTEAAG